MNKLLIFLLLTTFIAKSIDGQVCDFISWQLPVGTELEETETSSADACCSKCAVLTGCTAFCFHPVSEYCHLWNHTGFETTTAEVITGTIIPPTTTTIRTTTTSTTETPTEITSTATSPQETTQTETISSTTKLSTISTTTTITSAATTQTTTKPTTTKPLTTQSPSTWITGASTTTTSPVTTQASTTSSTTAPTTTIRTTTIRTTTTPATTTPTITTPTTTTPTTTPRTTTPRTTPTATTAKPTTTTWTGISSTFAPGVCPPSGFHIIANPYDCSKYYYCLDGYATEYQCEEGFFDFETLDCKPESEVDCNVFTDAPNSTKTAPTTTTAPVTTTLATTTVYTTTWVPISTSLAPGECPPEGTHMVAYPGDCSKYYLCLEGTPLEYSCPDAMLFDPASAQCRPESEVECNALLPAMKSRTFTNHTITATSSSRILANPQCPPEGTHMIPHPDDCSKYFLCLEGTALEYSCPAGMHFDPEAEQCRAESEVDCGLQTDTTNSETTTIPTSSSLAPGQCPPEGTSMIPYPDDCSKYFLCLEGTPLEYSCPAGMHFDPETEQCRPESEVDCELIREQENWYF